LNGSLATQIDAMTATLTRQRVSEIIDDIKANGPYAATKASAERRSSLSSISSSGRLQPLACGSFTPLGSISITNILLFLESGTLAQSEHLHPHLSAHASDSTVV
jgi:hypothetical protein